MGSKWTPEQRKAASERVKARMATKDKNPETKINNVDTPWPPIINTAEQHDPMSGPQPGAVADIKQPDYGDIQRMVNEMVEARMALTQPVPAVPEQNPWSTANGMKIGPQGQLLGVHEKYIMSAKRYPDPRDRLTEELRLQRFAFKENYDMEWEVGVSQYQTIAGVNTREPKFTLKLRRIMFDDDTGLPTNNRYVVCQAIFHEDPEAALVIAQENGYEVTASSEKEFLDEMRYIRMRDWLMEAFYPPKPRVDTKKKEMVVGNRVVEVFEINAETPQAIPFNQLDRNKRL